MHPKLVWVESLCSSLSLALITNVSHTIEDSVDPLKKMVFIDIEEELGKKDFNPLQQIIHAFAKANDCVVHRIYKSPKRLVLEVLTKTRRGPVCNRNPLHGDKR